MAKRKTIIGTEARLAYAGEVILHRISNLEEELKRLRLLFAILKPKGGPIGQGQTHHRRKKTSVRKTARRVPARKHRRKPLR